MYKKRTAEAMIKEVADSFPCIVVWQQAGRKNHNG